MSMVEAYLTKFVEGIDKMPQGEYRFWTFEQFVRAHGRHYAPSPLPLNWRRGRKGNCYRNAYYLADADRSLIYVEGFAAYKEGKYMGVCPGLHAWCATADGKALDPTWKCGIEYFGVAFDWQYVVETISQRSRFGVIDNWENQFPLLRGDAQGWQPKKAA